MHASVPTCQASFIYWCNSAETVNRMTNSLLIHLKPTPQETILSLVLYFWTTAIDLRSYSTMKSLLLLFSLPAVLSNCLLFIFMSYPLIQSNLNISQMGLLFVEDCREQKTYIADLSAENERLRLNPKQNIFINSATTSDSGNKTGEEAERMQKPEGEDKCYELLFWILRNLHSPTHTMELLAIDRCQGETEESLILY